MWCKINQSIFFFFLLKGAAKTEVIAENREKASEDIKVEAKESNGESEKMCVDEEMKKVPAEAPKEGAGDEDNNKSAFKRPRKVSWKMKIFFTFIFPVKSIFQNDSQNEFISQITSEKEWKRICVVGPK